MDRPRAEQAAVGDTSSLSHAIRTSAGPRVVCGCQTLRHAGDTYKMIRWLSNLPSELAYGLATSLVVAVGGWSAARIRRRRTARDTTTVLPAAAVPVPRVLPRAPQRFVNRERELAALDDLLVRAQDSSSPVIAVLSGLHGVGKSAIGSLWVHRNHERFTGGVLSADFSRRRNPHAEVSDVLGEFLRELGTSDVAMPTTLAARQRLFEQLTTDRKLLLLLDDIDQPTQALDALPAGGGSVVVVTSAFRLEELVRRGAQPIFLAPLDEPQARRLLVEMAGAARIGGEPDATRAVISACGGLPIALCVCGARLATRPDRTVAWLAGQLESWPERLSTLSPPGEFDVRAVFSVAYEDLTESVAMLYRRLGLHPGPDFAAPAAAALADVPLASVSALFEQLEDAYLLQSDEEGRWRPHDLVRDHMRSCAAEDESEDSREHAVRRVVDWYTAAARVADHAVVDDRLRLSDDTEMMADDLPNLRSPRDAFAWFAVERRNVIAAQNEALDREWYDRVWQIAEALWPLCASHKRFAEWIASHEAAIVAGEKLADTAVLARMRSQLARAYAERANAGLADEERAEAEIGLALSAARAAGDPRLLASVIEFGGVCQLRAGQFTRALESFRQARAGFEACGLERGVALQDYYIGSCLILAGDHELALDPLERARATMKRLGDDINVGRSLLRRGDALQRLNRFSEAGEALAEAIDVLDRAGVGFEQAEAHEAFAQIADETLDVSAARGHRQSAYRLYRELGHPRADTLLAMLEGVSAA